MIEDTRSGRGAGRVSEWFPWFVRATAVVAAVELGVLRLFTRTIVHIPGAAGLSPILSAVSTVGRFAYYLASVLLVATLVVLAAAFRDRRGGAVGAAVVVAFGAVALLARAGFVGDVGLALLVCGCVAAMGMINTRVHSGRTRLPVLLFVAAFLLAGLYAVVQAPGVAEPFAARALSPVLFATEALAVAAALASPVMLTRRPSRRVSAIGAAVALGAFGVLVANPSTTKILMLWTFGLAGYFPSWVYGAALGAVTVTVVGLVREDRGAAALGIALVVMGGIGLHSTYQSALVVVGLGQLALAARWSVPVRSPGRAEVAARVAPVGRPVSA
ncbi:MAG: hypothetical protein U0V73_10870 [Acidimicrobiia bacterium]